MEDISIILTYIHGNIMNTNHLLFGIYIKGNQTRNTASIPCMIQQQIVK